MKIFNNVSLKKYNTMNVDHSAKFMVRINDVSDLFDVYSSKLLANTNKLILGMGSNVLFTCDYPGTIMLMNIKGIAKKTNTRSEIYLKIGAGEIWDDLVRYTISHGLHGIENLALIPGTVGAAPVQNIGAYGMDVKDVIHEIEVFDTDKLRLLKLKNKDCAFSYRNSLFKENPQKYIICNVTLKLEYSGTPTLTYKALRDYFDKISLPSIKDVYNAVCEIRNSKLPDPEILPNLGSFFKNPEIDSDTADNLKMIIPEIPIFKIHPLIFRIPAARLIEQCGWRGKITGNCGVYDKHALILVNHNNAKGNEILELGEKIKTSVSKKFNIILEFEPRIV